MAVYHTYRILSKLPGQMASYVHSSHKGLKLLTMRRCDVRVVPVMGVCLCVWLAIRVTGSWDNQFMAPRKGWVSDDLVAPTQKGLLWASLYSARIRREDAVQAYLDYGIEYGSDTRTTPLLLLKAYLDVVAPTGFIILRSKSPPARSDVSLFREHFAHKIDHMYCLLSADGDQSMPSEDSDLSLLRDPRMMVWYSTNLNFEAHDKLKPIPIFLDLHFQRNTWAGRPQWDSPESMYEAMHKIRRQHSKSPVQRRRGAVLGHMSMTHSRRKNMSAVSRLDGVVVQPRVDLTSYWTNVLCVYRFGLSPRGNGIDCHRTWEMLFFNMIPIVERSSMDSVYAGLPVVIVDAFEDITSHQLDVWWDLYKDEVQHTTWMFHSDMWVDEERCDLTL